MGSRGGKGMFSEQQRILLPLAEVSQSTMNAAPASTLGGVSV
jgi:hypothetical protein